MKDRSDGVAVRAAVPGAGVTHFFLVVEAFVVVLHGRHALLLALTVVLAAVDDVTGHQLLPEGKAAGRAWGEESWSVSSCFLLLRTD